MFTIQESDEKKGQVLAERLQRVHCRCAFIRRRSERERRTTAHTETERVERALGVCGPHAHLALQAASARRDKQSGAGGRERGRTCRTTRQGEREAVKITKSEERRREREREKER